MLDQVHFDKRQQEADRAAIRDGIADMETGGVITLQELDARIRAKIRLIAPPCADSPEFPFGA